MLLQARLMLQLPSIQLLLFPKYSTGITLKLLQRRHRSKTSQTKRLEASDRQARQTRQTTVRASTSSKRTQFALGPVNSKQVSTSTRKKHCWARERASVEAFCENPHAAHFHDRAKCNADPRCQFDTRTCLASHPHYESICENPDKDLGDQETSDRLFECAFDGHHCWASNNPEDEAFCEDPQAAHFLDLEKCDQKRPRCHFGGPDPPHCWAKDPKELEAWREDETRGHFYDEAACDQDSRCAFEGHHCLASSSPEDLRAKAGFCENPSEPHFYDPKTCNQHAGCHFFKATGHDQGQATTSPPPATTTKAPLPIAPAPAPVDTAAGTTKRSVSEIQKELQALDQGIMSEQRREKRRHRLLTELEKAKAREAEAEVPENPEKTSATSSATTSSNGSAATASASADAALLKTQKPTAYYHVRNPEAGSNTCCS
eukprot:g16618.t1